MGELKESHNAFKKRKTKYLHTKFVSCSFAQDSINYIKIFDFLKTSGTIQELLSMRKTVTRRCMSH